MKRFTREFTEGSGRAMGYWFGKYFAIGVSMIVIKDVLDGTAEKRLKAAKRKLSEAKNRIFDKFNGRKDGAVYVFRVKKVK